MNKLKIGLILTSATTFGGLYGLRRYIRGTDVLVDPSVRADGKVVIVTGSNTGIGKETAKELANRGALVYMACRNMERCEKAKEEIVKTTNNPKVYCRKCDLADFASICQFVKQFKREQPRLDILINNGGVMHTPRMETKQGLELQFGVNHVGHFLLTTLLLDHLKKGKPSRIVVVSSFVHKRGKINFQDLNSEKAYSPTGAYEQSKLANVLFANHLARKLAGTGITVNSLHPGAIGTDLMRYWTFLEENRFGKYIVKPVLGFVLKTPYQGALTTLVVALDPSFRQVSGKYFSDGTMTLPAAHALHQEDALKLWKATKKLIRERSAGLDCQLPAI